MGRKILVLVIISFFWLYPPALKSQSSTETNGGKIKFQRPEEMFLSAISGQLTRCETYMDYLATGGLCRGFATKIGSVTDFSIGYLIRLWPEDYEAGDSFRWNFKGPKGLSIIGGYDSLLENGFYCWVSTMKSKTCPSEPGKPGSFMSWSIYPQNFHRPNTIIGTWTVVVTKNGTTIGQDSFTILPTEISDRHAAMDELDRRWNAMTQSERGEAVGKLRDFNDFLGSIAHVTERYITDAIGLAKQAYPQYGDFDAGLAKAIIQVESGPYGNYFGIGEREELGLGQEIYYCDVNRTSATIHPYQEYLELFQSEKTSQDFETFKEDTFADNRSLVIESIAILFAHVTEDLSKRDYIGNDIKKIAAGYNWGQTNLKKWLDYCAEKGIDWYENLTNKDYEYPEISIKARRRVANYIDDILDNYPRK